MSQNPPFDLVNNEFCLCCGNINIVESQLIIVISVIDSYTKQIAITQFNDNSFFTSYESLLKQIIPQHENTNYYILMNVPSQSIYDKINYIITQLACADAFAIEINNKQFKPSNDYWNILKMLFIPHEISNYELTYNKIEYINSLETLYACVQYCNLLQIDIFHNAFTLTKLNHKKYMGFDIQCVKCLNLFDNFEERKSYLNVSTLQKLAKNVYNSATSNSNRKTSVFGILNQCCTKFGTRTLRTWLMQPLQSIADINNRLNTVEALLSTTSFNIEMRNSYLSKIDDIQTINMKISRYINDKSKSTLKLVDCAKLQRCICVCKDLHAYLVNYEGVNKQLIVDKYITPLESLLKFLTKLDELIAETIVFDCELREYTIKPSLNKDLNELKQKIDFLYDDIKRIRQDIEDETNIISGNKKPRKVKIEEYKNFGYVFEVGKPDGDNLLRKKNNMYKLVGTTKRSVILTTSNATEISNQIRTLKNKFKSYEANIIVDVLNAVATYHPVIENLIILLASLDILSSFALLAANSTYPYTKPIMHSSQSKLIIKDSRHIILEHLPLTSSYTTLVSNDVSLTANEDNVHLITGVNMGGKSTYLRQVGICVILAHIGCYVPATYAEIPIIDQIFTRVGAGDFMLKGISTFMNEMIEVSSLIKSATCNSLLLIDEVGRGTSTDDGVGISYAILHHIAHVINAYCLFATHFYELTEIEKELHNVSNYYMSYAVCNGEMKMEYKVIKGNNCKSFGVGMFHSLNFDEATIEILKKYTTD